jgi:hypothetical protein
MLKFTIDYTQVLSTYYESVRDAVKKYLELEPDKGQGLWISAIALNPFLKTLEDMCEKGVIVIPWHNKTYLAIKTSLVQLKVKEIELQERTF